MDYLLETGHAQSREDAVQLGRSLTHEFNLFEHVTRDHEFADDHLFFRFVPENERGGLAKNDDIGKFVQWSDFLGPASEGRREDKETGSLLPGLKISANLDSVDRKDQHVSLWYLPSACEMLLGYALIWLRTLLIYVVQVVSQVWPLDEHNTNLLNNVHPPAWVDPNPHNADGTYSYDMVVIGGGTGGLITAAGSAGVGARVAMIEAHMLGGDW